MVSNCTLIEANPDISGIGIRANLYITMLVMALVPNIPGVTSPLLGVVAGNAGVSGAALLITAIVETAKHQLSLYHAIFILHILYFTGVMIAPAGNYSSNLSAIARRLIVIGILSYGLIFLFTGYSFYVWAKAPTFGNSPGCNNQVKYIFFFHSVRATVGWLRKLWMAMLGITLGFYIIIPLVSYACCYLAGGVPISEGSTPSRPTSSSVMLTMLTNIEKPLAAIYGVVMLELYVKRNRHLISPAEQNWTFGQILALVQIIRILNEMFHCLLNAFSWRNEREGGDSSSVQHTISSERRGWTKIIPWKRGSKHEGTSHGYDQ